MTNQRQQNAYSKRLPSAALASSVLGFSVAPAYALAPAYQNKSAQSLIKEEIESAEINARVKVTVAACRAAANRDVKQRLLCTYGLKQLDAIYGRNPEFTAEHASLILAGDALNSSQYIHPSYIDAGGIVRTTDIPDIVTSHKYEQHISFASHKHFSAVRQVTALSSVPPNVSDDVLSDATLRSLGLLPASYSNPLYPGNYAALFAAPTRNTAPENGQRAEVNYNQPAASAAKPVSPPAKPAQIPFTAIIIGLGIAGFAYVRTKKFWQSAALGGGSAVATFAVKKVVSHFCAAAAIATLPGTLAPAAAFVATSAIAVGFVSVGMRAIKDRNKPKEKYWWAKEFAKSAVGGVIGGAIGLGVAEFGVSLFSSQGAVHQRLFGNANHAGKTATAVAKRVSAVIWHDVAIAHAAPSMPTATIATKTFTSAIIDRLTPVAPVTFSPTDNSTLLHFKDQSYDMLRSGKKALANKGYQLLQQGVAFAQSHNIHNIVADMLNRDLKVQTLIRDGHIKAAADFYKSWKPSLG